MQLRSSSKYQPAQPIFSTQPYRYSTKSSIYQQQRTKKSLSVDSSQFSFCKGQFDSGKNSIRQDLYKLDKQHLIQILIDQIEQSKMLRIKLATMQDQCKILGSFREDIVEEGNSAQFVTIAKYQQLANYMEQYISNTNQAQNYFTSALKQLKNTNSMLQKQKSILQQTIKQMKSTQQNQLSSEQLHQQLQKSKQKIKEQEQIIKNLQNSLTQYMNINNQNTRKYEKLKKIYDLLQQQLSMALESYRDRQDSLDNINQCGGIKQKINGKQNCIIENKVETKQVVELIQKIKILEINNYQLKQAYAGMQKTLQNKSEKIRKLLQQMQKLSEQKWLYKQKYMQIKSKSYITHSSSKNSVFDSYSHHQPTVLQFQSSKS